VLEIAKSTGYAAGILIRVVYEIAVHLVGALAVILMITVPPALVALVMVTWPLYSIIGGITALFVAFVWMIHYIRMSDTTVRKDMP
jgi:hypothetical protein